MQKDMNAYKIDDWDTWPRYKRGSVVLHAKKVEGAYWVQTGSTLRRTAPGDYIVHNGVSVFIEQPAAVEQHYVPVEG